MTNPVTKGRGCGITFLRAHIDDHGGECLIWPMSYDDRGYPVCAFNGRNYKAGALMCELVHGPKPTPKHHAAHSCGNGQLGCVHPEHVRWATPKENMQDSVRLGACNWKGRRPHRILTEETVAQILAMRGKGTYDEIASRFGVKPKQIGKILRGEHWKGGKKGRHGFAPGDPRNIGWMKMRAARQLKATS